MLIECANVLTPERPELMHRHSLHFSARREISPVRRRAVLLLGSTLPSWLFCCQAQEDALRSLNVLPSTDSFNCRSDLLTAPILLMGRII